SHVMTSIATPYGRRLDRGARSPGSQPGGREPGARKPRAVSSEAESRELGSREPGAQKPRAGSSEVGSPDAQDPSPGYWEATRILAGQAQGRAPPPPSPQRATRKPVSPVGSRSATSTVATFAYRGPDSSQLSSCATVASAPSASTSTRPSRRLRTNPLSPSRSACTRVFMRKPTPCTSPLTRARLRTTVMQQRYADSRPQTLALEPNTQPGGDGRAEHGLHRVGSAIRQLADAAGTREQPGGNAAEIDRAQLVHPESNDSRAARASRALSAARAPGASTSNDSRADRASRALSATRAARAGERLRTRLAEPRHAPQTSVVDLEQPPTRGETERIRNVEHDPTSRRIRARLERRRHIQNARPQVITFLRLHRRTTIADL